MILTHPGLTKLTFIDYLLTMLRILLRRKQGYDTSEACGPPGVSGEGASAPVWVTPPPATADAAARFRAVLSVGDTGDRSHLCRSTWCPRLWRLNLGTCVCMHTWGGRPRPDVRVRSPREARPQVAAPPRAAGSIATAALGLPPLTCSLHVAARISPVWAYVGCRVHTCIVTSPPRGWAHAIVRASAWSPRDARLMAQRAHLAPS